MQKNIVMLYLSQKLEPGDLSQDIEEHPIGWLYKEGDTYRYNPAPRKNDEETDFKLLLDNLNKYLAEPTTIHELNQGADRPWAVSKLPGRINNAVTRIQYWDVAEGHEMMRLITAHPGSLEVELISNTYKD